MRNPEFRKKEIEIMIYCNRCGAQLEDGASFCCNCGNTLGGGGYNPPVPVYVDPSDHTAEFDPKDISENKVIAMAAYVLGMVGIIIALLAAPKSAYAAFHSRQALKLEIVNMLMATITLVLCWTIIVPIAYGVCTVILLVVRIICFFQVCSGKAKDAAIIGALPFLR